MSKEKPHLKTPRRSFLAGIAGTAVLSNTVSVTGREHGEDEEGSNLANWKPTAHNITANDGLCLRIWERTFAEDPDEAVLFVHGATYGAVSMFDPPVTEGYGWLSFAAEHGQAAFAVDLRGYGESELPPEYEEPPEENTPVLSRSTLAGDVYDALRFIQEDQGFDRVHLVGLSAGTWRARALYNEYDPELATVTLAGGSFRDLDVGADPSGPAYGTQVREEFIERWTDQIPEGEDPDQWIGGDEFTADEVQSAVWDAIFDTNQAIDDDPETILTPNRLAEKEDHPEHITDPTLVIRGSSDPLITREGALQLYDAVGAAEHRKQYTEIAGGTHFIFVEDKRRELFETTHHFQTLY